ncbi:hypothetical protein DFH07DRAFT_853187 [Mycena maculata]|uniref:Uncharacterized protein n=1 Tax=Mycena maculata TaxID=230809 RepID=A0AAD7MNX8_9AGAR|nr:hypothetical protein DFH07DRAFT_853187 [Mycena maculata]
MHMRSASGATTHSTSTNSNREGWGSSDSDDELGLGGGADEDRTVTARSASGSSRRALSYNLAGGSPPPPVPPLPSAHQGNNHSLGIDIVGGMGMQPQPFPRSPTASVFSAPDSASIAYTHTSAGSTTALTRPHGQLMKGRGLAGLPPSPPIHKERERRRLRKKSRPGAGGAGAQAVVEMREMRKESSEETNARAEGEDEDEDWDAEDLGAGASGGAQGGGGVYTNPGTGASRSSLGTPASLGPGTPYGAQPVPAESGSHVALPGAQGLLSRIGSVKRWGFGGKEREGRNGKKGSSVSVASESESAFRFLACVGGCEGEGGSLIVLRLLLSPPALPSVFPSSTHLPQLPSLLPFGKPSLSVDLTSPSLTPSLPHRSPCPFCPFLSLPHSLNTSRPLPLPSFSSPLLSSP